MVYKEYVVPLNITADEYQRMYRGDARNVFARDAQGRSLQFPASCLRPHVTHEGIQGVFVIRVDENNRLVDVRRKTA